jgi:23S rRNA (pseudouridine1915-N3)-methyltransferase
MFKIASYKKYDAFLKGIYMVHINIICVGKIKEQYLRDAIDEYSKRLSKYSELNIIELPDEPIPNNPSQAEEQKVIDNESNKILKTLPAGYNICLDLSGKQYSSEEFAEKLQDLQLTNSTINFIIGGSLGMNQNLKNYCNEKICFSKMTFPHQLIRVFLLEQIYRAFKINNHEKYHK